MSSNLLKYFGMYIILVLIQVLFFNNIHLSGMLNPYVYVLFILLLPFDTPKYLLLILGFLLGLSIDVFSSTPGMHASASVFAAFIRPAVLNLLSPRDEYEKGTSPAVYYYGFMWFLKYTLILIFAHHFFLFFVEAFSFANFLQILSRGAISATVTSGLILMSQFVMYRK